MALTITRDATLVVRVPMRTPLWYVERLVREKADWIQKGITKMRSLPQMPPRRSTRREYLRLKEEARALVHLRIQELNKPYGFKYGRISIRNQKSRWGSCSKNGNLNFNYRIVQLPAHLADYLIVHELCHLKELNHGKRFWELVAKTIPDYAKRRKQLRTLT
jgi:predicted metal-dependent hydrolase